MAVTLIYQMKYVTLQIASPYITKRMCKQDCLQSKRKVLSTDLKESKDAESCEKKLSNVLTGHLLNMRMNNLFLSLIPEQKKTKQ